MFVYTVTKKRAVRLLLVVLAIIAGIIIGIAAILTSISTGADERKVPIYHVDRSDNKVALTFNCAWGNSNTDELLAILERENIRATFFVTGEFADKYPEDVLRMHKAGHEIQSHSDRHPHVEGANINDLIHDTREASRKISAITGVAPTLYRAPYGEYDNNSIRTINGMGYKYIQWSVDSIDWQEPNAETIVRRVANGTQSGSIILFHNDLANTTEALPEVISSLKKRGFAFATVSELIHWENYSIDSSGRQVLNADAQIHTAGTHVNDAFEALLENLTIDEIMSLEHGLTPEMTLRLSSILTSEQINAISALSDEELQAAWGALVDARVMQAQANYPLAMEGDDNTKLPPGATTPITVPGEKQIPGAGAATAPAALTTTPATTTAMTTPATTTPATTAPNATEKAPGVTAATPAATTAATPAGTPAATPATTEAATTPGGGELPVIGFKN